MSIAAIFTSLTLAFAATGVQGPGGHRGPPKEAIEACAQLDEGSACSFEGRRGAVEGTCWRPDDSKPLACRPTDAPPPPDSNRS